MPVSTLEVRWQRNQQVGRIPIQIGMSRMLWPAAHPPSPGYGVTGRGRFALPKMSDHDKPGSLGGFLSRPESVNYGAH